MVKVFWMEPTDLVRVTLRRFTFTNDKPCRATDWGHDADARIADSDLRTDWPGSSGDHPDVIPHDDPRWPQECEKCGEPFQLDDEWQLNVRQLYSGAPDGRLYNLWDAPVGAMWDAHWMSDWRRGPDGLCLVVRTPGGDWTVDGEASNCTRKGEPHQCWVRHGDPRTGDVHVDKDGDTCAAGAGSIAIGSYHGFLRNGHLTDC